MSRRKAWSKFLLFVVWRTVDVDFLLVISVADQEKTEEKEEKSSEFRHT